MIAQIIAWTAIILGVLWVLGSFLAAGMASSGASDMEAIKLAVPGVIAALVGVGMLVW